MRSGRNDAGRINDDDISANIGLTAIDDFTAVAGRIAGIIAYQLSAGHQRRIPGADKNIGAAILIDIKNAGMKTADIIDNANDVAAIDDQHVIA